MQRNKKRHFVLAAWLVVVLLTLAVFAADTTQPQTEEAPRQYAYIANQSIYFYDVDEAYPWAFHEIDYLASANIIQGTDNFLFEPDESISRADFVLMLYRAYDMSAYQTGSNFDDVPEDAYYADAVRAAKALGIVNGDNETTFHPTVPITRQDAMVLLSRTISRTGIVFSAGDLSKVADANQIAPYARDAVGGLYAAGVVQGDEEGMRPTGQVSRGETAVMLYRALMLQTTEDGVHYETHPEQINLCIGDDVYSGVEITNFDPQKHYSGLVSYTDFKETQEGHIVTIGESLSQGEPLQYKGTVVEVAGEEVAVAQGCEAVRVNPYSVLEALTSTGEEYPSAVVSYNEKGEAAIIYYFSK